MLCGRYRSVCWGGVGGEIALMGIHELVLLARVKIGTAGTRQNWYCWHASKLVLLARVKIGTAGTRQNWYC